MRKNFWLCKRRKYDMKEKIKLSGVPVSIYLFFIWKLETVVKMNVFRKRPTVVSLISSVM